MSPKDEINKLKSQQEKDKYSPTVKPQIIQPTKKIYLPGLTALERICYVIWLSRAVTFPELSKCIKIHPKSIHRIVKRAREKLAQIQ